jgi:hypothetical protein
LESTASLYACLGYRRKEAYILREVLGCILDLIGCGREEDGFSRLSSVPLPSGLGIQGPSSSQRGNVGVRFSENIDGNESVLRLLKYVCKVLGINLDAVRLLETSDADITEVQSAPASVEDDVATEFMEPYGWPELQVGVVREAVAVAEALPGTCLFVSIKAIVDLEQIILRSRNLRYPHSRLCRPFSPPEINIICTLPRTEHL